MLGLNMLIMVHSHFKNSILKRIQNLTQEWKVKHWSGNKLALVGCELNQVSRCEGELDTRRSKFPDRKRSMPFYRTVDAFYNGRCQCCSGGTMGENAETWYLLQGFLRCNLGALLQGILGFGIQSGGGMVHERYNRHCYLGSRWIRISIVRKTRLSRKSWSLLSWGNFLKISIMKG